MNIAYSAVLPEQFTRVGEVVHMSYNVVFEDATEDRAAQYRYEYIELPVALVESSPMAVYFKAVAEKINAQRAIDEQIGILRKFLAGISAKVAALETAVVEISPGTQIVSNEYAMVFDAFNVSAEGFKASTKSDLGLS